MRNNKRVLFFSPKFFGYEKSIVTKMEEMGYYVDYYNDRPISKANEKALFKVMPFLFKNKAELYYESIFKEISVKEYDYIFIIKADFMTKKFLSKLKNRYKKSIFCLYLWDSIENINGINNKFKYFDRIFSFDSVDAEKNVLLNFRPLFYIDDYKTKYEKNKNYKYDLSFCGTIHSDRYKIIKLIQQFGKENNMSFYFFKYLQGEFMYLFYKITKKEFYKSTKNDFDFKKISSAEIAEIVACSKAVLDIQHPKQTGLTMRTIEMLGMHKKIITTNKFIKSYDFYNPQNIMIIDRDNPELSIEFLNSEYEPLDLIIYEKYSLESWIKDILY